MISSSPVTEDQPDADLLQQSVPEVGSTCIFIIIVDVGLYLSREGRLLTRLFEEMTPEKFSLLMYLPQNGVPPPSPGTTGGEDSLLAPPSVATLLDISLPGPPEEALAPGEPQTHISDSIIELAINSAHYGTDFCLYIYIYIYI